MSSYLNISSVPLNPLKASESYEYRESVSCPLYNRTKITRFVLTIIALDPFNSALRMLNYNTEVSFLFEMFRRATIKRLEHLLLI